MNIIETLRELGFTEGEIRVYLALVKLGSTTIGPIINEAQVSNSKIYILLEKLTKKGIVSYIFKGKTKYFQASSPNYLYDILELEQNKINKLKDSLKEVIDFIEKNSDKSKEESKIYKGYNGMKSAWFEAIKSIPLCGKYYFFSKGYGKDSYLKSFFRNLSLVRARKILSATGRNSIKIMISRTTALIIQIYVFPKLYPNTPTAEITIKATISVNLSAKTIIAVFEIGIWYLSFKRYDFKTSPSFPGVIDIENPAKNILNDSIFGILIFNIFR